jgi:hypothetical protein
MSEAAAPKQEKRPRVTELNVSGHLMTLETGLFCILQTPAKAVDAASGLPGVRLSVPPGAGSRPDAVQISSFRNDGWLSGFGDAALVRVSAGPAQLLVTVYQAPGGEGTAPNLQVLRLLDNAAAQPQAAPPAAAAAEAHAPTVMDMVAHIQGRGDVGALLGDWLGERGSKRWVEGFAVSPAHDVPPQDIEYQAVLGRGWLSPWAEGGQFCGSRGMALPVLGLRLRLRGASAQTHECSYSATFTDGTEIGPVGAGEACEADSLAPMEAFHIEIRPRGTAAKAPAKAEAKPTPKPSAKPTAKSGAAKPAAPKRGAPQPAAPKPTAKPPAAKPSTPKDTRRR